MKNNKTTYFLIPVVVLIWGYVAFSITNFGEEEEEIAPIRIEDLVKSNLVAEKNIILVLNYPDPFMKNIRRSRTTSVSTKKPKPKKPEKLVDWGQVKYNGYLQNSEKNKKIALLSLENRQVLGEISKTYGGIQIKEIREDSILLYKNKTTKWFRKFKN